MSLPPAHGPHALDRMAQALGAERRRGHVRVGGLVTQASPTHYRVAGLSRHVHLGECVEFEAGGRKALAQVVRIDANTVTIEAFEGGTSLGLGHPVWRRGPLVVAPAESWKGRIIDALARPIDRKGPLEPGIEERDTESSPPDPMTRQRVRQPLTTSVKVIDVFTPICAGQRIGIFAGSGVGKSTLLGMLTRSRSFDSTVVALVGERGREVREFVEDILGDALASTVVVVATGDESPMMRRQAPRTAMAVAEFLRDRGDNVLLVFDSITRYAHALREVALAAGEPPVARAVST